MRQIHSFKQLSFRTICSLFWGWVVLVVYQLPTQAQPAERLQTLHYALQSAETTGNALAAGEAAWALAFFYYGQQPDSAIVFLSAAHEWYQRAGAHTYAARSLNSIGNLYHDNNKPTEAAEYYFRAITWADSLSVAPEYHGLFLLNSGRLLHKQGDFLGAKKHLQRAQQLFQVHQVRQPKRLRALYARLGRVYAGMQQPDSALWAFQQSLKAAVAQGRPQKIAREQHNVGEAYFQLSQYDSAEAYFQQALMLSLSLGDSLEVAYIYLRLGNTYFQAGQLEKDTEKLQEAQAAYQMAVAFMERLQVLEGQAAAVRNLGMVQYHLGEYKQAYLTDAEYQILADSLAAQQNLAVLQELRLQYEAAEKDRRLLALRQQALEQKLALQRSQQWLIGGGIGGSLTMALIVLLFYAQRQRWLRLRTEQENAYHELAFQQEKTHLEALVQGQETERKRLARELHDGIGNTLAVLQLQSQQTNQTLMADWQQLIRTAQQEVRMLSHNITDQYVARFGLMEAARQLCDRIQTQELEVLFEAHGNDRGLPESQALILYRVTQELLSNALKHARATEISVQVTVRPERIAVTVEDNGVGFNLDAIQEGLGLQNIRGRLQLLGATFVIDSSPGSGTVATVALQPTHRHGNADQTDSDR